MAKKSAFGIAKTRTPKGEARLREQVTMGAMDILTAIGSLEEFNEVLESKYGIKPGQPRYTAALSAWNEAQALKRPHR